ncbi:MAG TPA: AAA family ATPase [Ktedonobacteraceae bacterium]|nr:AAA family ATPase [Ktedonobacteraceae bacterium]
MKGAFTINTQITPDPSELSVLLGYLSRPQAFPQELAIRGPIPVIQTHASAVILAGGYAYKLKKARNFGFFDYSTPELRRQFCEQEVLLNSRLAPHIYQGIAPVLEEADGTLRFGRIFAPGQIPTPNTLLGAARVVDYAVVMQRLPEEATLAAHVAARTATPNLLALVAEPLVQFHTSVPTNKHIAEFGSLSVIRGNWDENFEQMRPYIGRSLDQSTFDRLSTYIYDFMQGYAALFSTRIHEQRIRDCHGDLRLQHVYIFEQAGDVSPGISVVDCIEFNERFRYGDVASEVAFLTMELDAAERSDLARAFIDAYVSLGKDMALYELLPFYACYRACVRGKVLSFQLDQPEVPQEQRQAVLEEARKLFALAASNASGPTRPTLLLVGGLMGTGKSTLAKALSEELGWTLISSDLTRKQLIGLEPSQPQTDAFGEGIYSSVWTARTYQAMLDQAARVLATGRSVILDATFARLAHRHAASQEATLHGANHVFVECQVSRDLALSRLAERWKVRVARQPALSSSASDARPELYDTQAASWQPFSAEEEPATEHLVISSSSPLSLNLARVLDALSIPQHLRRREIA